MNTTNNTKTIDGVSIEAMNRIEAEMELHELLNLKTLAETTDFEIFELDRLAVAIHTEFGIPDTKTIANINNLLMSLIESHTNIDYIIGMILFNIEIGFDTTAEIDFETWEEK